MNVIASNGHTNILMVCVSDSEPTYVELNDIVLHFVRAMKQ